MDRVDYQSIIIQDLLNFKKQGELDISPWYQRRSVWSPAQKSYLINTLLEQKPIPAIYIRHSLDLEKAKSIKEIVDGQQRTRTIIDFYNNKFSVKHPLHNKKVKFSQLKPDQQQKFLLTAIPVGYLLGASDSDVIDIFGRINSVSKALNPQEKRNAKYSGEMKQFCLTQASSRLSFWRSYGIFTANDIARMNEIQFISDVVFNLIYGLSDFTSKNIDNLYKQYDEEFDKHDEIENRLDTVFNRIASMDPTYITDTIFKRQPIFFSLIMALDSLASVKIEYLERMLQEIDNRFNAEENKSKEDIGFADACKASTQRIAQRKIRDSYIKSFF